MFQGYRGNEVQTHDHGNSNELLRSIFLRGLIST